MHAKHRLPIAPRLCTTSLRGNIEAFRKAQDRARQGADPQLRAKREVFERELAKQVLSGDLKAGVDANLELMCRKAEDYINKLPAERRAAAFASLGVAASGGYAGAVLTGTDPAEHAKTMLAVLREGNVRERMIALGKFAELVASDMHIRPQDFESVARRATGAAGEFGTAEIAGYRARMEQFRKDKQAAGIAPEHKDYLKDFLKPLSTEKSGSQAEFQAAKKQEMDTKIPALTPEHPDQKGAGVFADVLPETTNPKQKGTTGSGESSSLARTTVTVEEAETMGYELSPREKAIADANGGRLPWVVGTIANVVDPSAQFIAQGAQNSLPQKAGISGTTFRFMEASQLLGGDPHQSRMAMVGALQVIDAHTIYEIASASKGFGLPFDPARPYTSLGIDRNLLDRIALRSGTTLAELDGETKANAPKAQGD